MRPLISVAQSLHLDILLQICVVEMCSDVSLLFSQLFISIALSALDSLTVYSVMLQTLITVNLTINLSRSVYVKFSIVLYYHSI